MRFPHGPLIAAEPQVLVRIPVACRDRPNLFACCWLEVGASQAWPTLVPPQREGLVQACACAGYRA